MSPFDQISQLGLPTAFPEFFPPQLELYRRSIAEGADAPDEYAVGHMLAAAATAAGADVSACVQPGWYVRCNLFFALLGYKGSGKSPLADKCFDPLVHREAELRDALARPAAAHGANDHDDDEDEAGHDDGYGDDDDDEEDDDFCDDESDCGADAEQPNPCLVINDCTGPAVLQLLARNRRQLLVNPDEMAGQFARGNGGSDRAMWCELYDGRRRRRERATTKAGSATLANPYVCIIGSIQPDRLSVLYNSRGDDGLLDRFFLVGDGVMREARWPRDADDPILNAAWSTVISRLLRIEEKAADSIGQQVEARFTDDAREVCKGLMARLNDLVVVLDVPNAQRGVVKKLVQHSVKLALLHRCLRWAAGEFGDCGPLGDVDADDAIAAREATLFFLGRWLFWRKELWGRRAVAATGPVGLSRAAGDDPVLRSLAGVAAGAQRTVAIVERLVRFLRGRGSQPCVLATLAAVQVFSGVAPDELRLACNWLVDNGHAAWLDPDCRTLRLAQPASPVEHGRSKLVASVTEKVT
jgi:hypothetical protein